MPQKIILIGAGVGIGVVFGALILVFSDVYRGICCRLFALMNYLFAFTCGLLFLDSEQVVSLFIFPASIISNQSNLVSLNPNYVTGFSDGESWFDVRISQNKKCSTGWVVEAILQITLHEKDLALLELIKASLKGVGQIMIMVLINIEYIRWKIYQ
jgi:hypothetical protein